MPQIENADEARSVARLIQSGQISGPARDTAMQALRDFDIAHTAALGAIPAPQSGAGRRAALTGRAAVEGVASVPTGPADLLMNSPVAPIVAPANPVALVGAGVQGASGHSPAYWLVRAFNKLSGANVPETESFQGMLENALTGAGAPTPQTNREKLEYAATKGAAAGVTGGLGAGATGISNAIRAGMSGLTGGAAAEAVKQAGGGPLAQTGAALVGGMAPSVVEGVATRLIPAVIKPVTRSGQEQIAADIMSRRATNPQQAAANLEAAQSVVPGSMRTTGEASQDVGLLALEKGVRGRNTAAFGERLSEQNAARQKELAALGGTPADIQAAQAARAAQTDVMREAALGNARAADTAPVHASIDSMLASPAGKRETIAKALEWAKGQIGDETDPAALYEIRKDLQLAQMGKLQPSNPNAPNASTLALARGQLGKVIESLDNSIEAAAPGFKAYLARYRDMSQPIDQMKVIQQIRDRASLNTADITTGQNFLSADKFANALDAAAQKSGNKITPAQMQRLEAIRTDLQYGQAINGPLVKAPGSDTFQNLSIAQVLGAGVSDAHPALRVLTKPLSWVYKLAGSDEAINQRLAEAMLDPKIGAQMLRRASPESVQKFSEALRMWLLPYQSGTAQTIRAIPAQSQASRSK